MPAPASPHRRSRRRPSPRATEVSSLPDGEREAPTDKPTSRPRLSCAYSLKLGGVAFRFVFAPGSAVGHVPPSRFISRLVSFRCIHLLPAAGHRRTVQSRLFCVHLPKHYHAVGVLPLFHSRASSLAVVPLFRLDFFLNAFVPEQLAPLLLAMQISLSSRSTASSCRADSVSFRMLSRHAFFSTHE